MCHGLVSDPGGAVSVGDLLRTQCYPEYEKGAFDDSGIDFPMIDESELLQQENPAEEGGAALEDYSSAVKKLEECEDDDSAWLVDCIKDDSVAPLVEPKVSPREEAPLEPNVSPHEEVSKAPKSRKARKTSAVTDHSHAQQDDSEMDDVLIDEKRKRRMSSNRASAQRSRQRKQERLDELEILTAQLRLENATLARRSKMAEQLARRIETEKKELAKQVEELRKELDATRHPRTHGSSASGDDSSDTCGNHNSAVYDNMVEEGETSPEVQLEVQRMPASKTTSTSSVKLSSADLSSGLFQELYDAFESDQFDVTLGGAVSDLDLQEEWYGSFTDCLNA